MSESRPTCNHSKRVRIHNETEFSDHQYPPTWPPRQERINLLLSFIDIHSWYTHKSILYAISSSLGSENLGTSKLCVIFHLTYREECGGNPSVAFNLEEMKLSTLSEGLANNPGASAWWETGRPSREVREAYMRDRDPQFSSNLQVCYRMEDEVQDFCLWSPLVPQTMSIHFPEAYAFFDSRVGDRQLEEIQRMVRMGLVYRRGSEADPLWRLGTLRKRGRKWRWETLKPQELVSLGLPLTHGFPGC